MAGAGRMGFAFGAPAGFNGVRSGWFSHAAVVERSAGPAKRVRTRLSMMDSSFSHPVVRMSPANSPGRRASFPQRKRRPSYRRTSDANRHLYRAFDSAMRGKRGKEVVETLRAIVDASKMKDDSTDKKPLVTYLDYGDMHAAVERCMELGHWRNGVEAIHLISENMPLVRRSTLARATEGLVKAGRVTEATALLSSAWEWVADIDDQDNKDRSIPDERLCAMVANAAVESRQTALASSVIDEMVENGIPAGCFSYSVLIKGHARDRRVDAVETLHNEMKERGVPRDTVIFNGIVDSYIRAGMTSKAMETVEEMKKAHLPPNARTYNTLLKGLSMSGKVSECFDFREKMIADGIEPNGVTRNTLIAACVRARLFDEAKKLLDEMAVDLTQETGAVFAYTTMVHGLAMDGRLDEAFEYVNELESSGVPANLVTYTALISAYIRVDEAAKAWFLFRGMRRVGLSPDANTYRAMISGLCGRRDLRSVDAAHGLVEEMTKLGMPVLDETYNSLMDGYVGVNMMTEAEKVFSFLKSPTVVSFTTLLQGYGKAQDMVKARQIFRSMREQGIKPDRIALNTFLSACIRCRDMGLALRVFREMEKAGGPVQPNVVTYGALILGYAKESRPDDSWNLYNRMKERQIKPNELVLNRLLQACVRGLLPIEYGVEIIEDMVDIGCSPRMIAEKKAELRPLLAVASEVWKSTDGIQAEPSESDRIFERHGWNVVNSSFRTL